MILEVLYESISIINFHDIIMESAFGVWLIHGSLKPLQIFEVVVVYLNDVSPPLVGLFELQAEPTQLRR